jgi:adenylylsulfate kinase
MSQKVKIIRPKVKGVVVWFTGHSKAGKTTLTKLLYHELKQIPYKVIRLDSDTLPEGIIKPAALDWEQNQRQKNENLIFLSKLLFENGYIVLISSVGRYNHWREMLRSEVPHYLEIYLKCPLDVRIQRDKAKYESHNEYFHFYEEPQNPDLIVKTDQLTPHESLQVILQLFQKRGYM